MTTAEQLSSAVLVKGQMMAATQAVRNAALLAMADALERRTEEILSANALDVEAARASISDVMIDRLRLSEARIAAMADAVRKVASLPDPLGRILQEYKREDGLLIRKVSVPIGVLAMIYVIQFLTVGGFIIWQVIDIIRILCGCFDDKEGRII